MLPFSNEFEKLKLMNTRVILLFHSEYLHTADFISFGTPTMVRGKKNGWTRPLNFGKRNHRSCIVLAATLAPFLVRFMTQSDTMAHGTDHKTWETTLSPSGSGTVLTRNHHAVSSTLPFFPSSSYRCRERERERDRSDQLTLMHNSEVVDVQACQSAHWCTTAE